MTPEQLSFVPAGQVQTWTRLALMGIPGGGKTYTSLEIACELARLEGKPVVLIDSEHGSAAKYAAMFDFQTTPRITDFDPEVLIKTLLAAEAQGFGVCIVDSLSHWWNGPGGLLERNDDYASRHNVDSFRAWGSYGTPTQRRAMDALLAVQMHVIATMRTKHEYQIITRENDTIESIRKIGTKPTQRDDVEYEFDVTAYMRRPGLMDVDKARIPWMSDQTYRPPYTELAGRLHQWVSAGEAPAAADHIELRLGDDWQQELVDRLERADLKPSDLAGIVGTNDEGRLQARAWLVGAPGRSVESLVDLALEHKRAAEEGSDDFDDAPAPRPATPDPIEQEEGAPA